MAESVSLNFLYISPKLVYVAATPLLSSSFLFMASDCRKYFMAGYIVMPVMRSMRGGVIREEHVFGIFHITG